MWDICIGSSGAELKWCLPAAFALDLALGDPRWLPHPVRLIGWFATRLESILVYLLGRTYVTGLLFTVLIVSGTWLATAALLAVAASWDWRAGLVAETLALYTTLAARDLAVETSQVYRA